jgi:DNA-directed RNA polymerase sigma subunit (sigma70/sigma32)
VGERAESRAGRVRTRLRVVRGTLAGEGDLRGLTEMSPAPQPLLSPPDAAISMKLREQTRMVLSMLTPTEQRVLQMRFGIGETRGHSVEEIGRRFVLAHEQILLIEARALRKLRHPTRGSHLRSVIRA